MGHTMNGLKRGWAVAKESCAVLRGQPKLLTFPLCSAAAVLVLLAAAPLVAIFGVQLPRFEALTDNQQAYVAMAFLFIVYFLCFYAALFFNAALIVCVLRYFQTGRVSIGEGLAVAVARAGSIFVWAIVASTVGLAIKSISDTISKPGGRNLGFIASMIAAVVGSVVSTTWIALSYFVLPVLVVEGLGPIAALKRSAALIAARWKDVIGGEARFGLLGLLVALPLIAIAIALGFVGDAGPLLAVGFAFVAIALMAVVFSTMSTIFLAAVYSYAANGEVPPAFPPELVQTALRTKT